MGIKIRNNNLVASSSWSSEPYLIKIENHCPITGGVKILLTGAVIRHKYPDSDAFGKVVIGDYVYLGNNVFIMPRVTIGNHVLIAAGSVETKFIPSNCVVAGNPARIIRILE